jgi:hypothetical protein
MCSDEFHKENVVSDIYSELVTYSDYRPNIFKEKYFVFTLWTTLTKPRTCTEKDHNKQI